MLGLILCNGISLFVRMCDARRTTYQQNRWWNYACNILAYEKSAWCAAQTYVVKMESSDIYKCAPVKVYNVWNGCVERHQHPSVSLSLSLVHSPKCATNLLCILHLSSWQKKKEMWTWLLCWIVLIAWLHWHCNTSQFARYGCIWARCNIATNLRETAMCHTSRSRCVARVAQLA